MRTFILLACLLMTIWTVDSSASDGVINIQVDNKFWCYAGGEELDAGVPGELTEWWYLYKLHVTDINRTPIIGCLFQNLRSWTAGNPGAAVYTTSTGLTSGPHDTHCVPITSRPEADSILPGWQHGRISQPSTTQSLGQYGVGPWGRRFPADMSSEAEWVWPAPAQAPYAVCFIHMKEVYDCAYRNPCTSANTSAGKFYHPHVSEEKFVQCSQWGQCYVMPCGPGTKWNQNVLNCT